MAYETGSGIAQDYNKARYWYRKAAEGGDPDAQNSLGHLLYAGLGGSPDRLEALQWLRAAAANGDLRAALNLGIVLSDAQASESDRVVAVTWLEIARQRGFDPGPALPNVRSRLTQVENEAAVQNAAAWLATH